MNDNDTVEMACEVLNRYPQAEVCEENGLTVLNNKFIANRILAAHKREIAMKDVERKGILKANESLAEYNDRLHDEIASLRALVNDLADALKKIDDACDGDMCKHFIDTEQCSKCKYLETCQTGIAHKELKTNESEIAKAREVVE